MAGGRSRPRARIRASRADTTQGENICRRLNRLAPVSISGPRVKVIRLKGRTRITA